jgi:CYTH domain-containing protein/thymidylate kinase
MKNNEIFLIAITGGPCGGKSTFLAKAHDLLQSYGIQPIVVAETATELINAGVTADFLGLEAFEEFLTGYQLERENRYLSAIRQAQAKHPLVILCDRGTLDGKAYIDEGMFANIVARLGYSTRDLMHRYKLVVHLVTAALGAEESYTLSNNQARTEDIDEAKRLDARIQQAWLGHPHHIIIDNRTGFDKKILRALQSFARVLDMPQPFEIERKFRVLNFDPSFIPPDAVAVNITQDYLLGNPEKERRVRIADLNEQKTFFYTEKIETGEEGKRIEHEKIISHRRYLELYAERDPSLRTIKKIRHCFFFGGRKFELDIYQEPLSISGLVILEIELPEIDEVIEFPDGWKLQEVTDAKEFKNRSLAENP